MRKSAQLAIAGFIIFCSVTKAEDQQVEKNSIGMSFVKIPAGRFLMGTPRPSYDRTVDSPAHEVKITRDFYLGVHEVTREQWKLVLSAGEWDIDNDLPALVTWNEANEFCERLSALPAENQSGRHYQLPTEAEWEYACRAETTTNYSFGQDESLLDDHAWYAANSKDEMSLVGRKRPNAWGLFDMHGNAWEWCSDRYGTYWIYRFGTAIDPTGPATGSLRTVRGGNVASEARHCRSAHRRGANPSNDRAGFRVLVVSVTPIKTELDE